MGLEKEVRKIVREAERQGFRVRPTKKGWIIYGRHEGQGCVVLHRTPSDQRGLKNSIADLRRLGFRWKGR
jgi:hypothetical protein